MSDATPSPIRATLAQVAELSGVSLKTASRAWGGEKYVSEGTQSRVLAAARELGYQRNTAAAMLASGKFTDDISFIGGELSNPFYATVAAGLEDAIHGRGMHLAVASSHESSDHEWRVAQSLADMRTKAIVVASAMPEHSRYAELQNRGIPVVFVDRPAVDLAADSVVFDNRSGAQLATTHLLEHGHRRIAFIGDYGWLPTLRDRIAGMGEVLDTHKVADWQRLVRTDIHDVAAAKAVTEELLALAAPPTAIIAGNNRITLGVTQALSATDGGHPTVALVGFDDFDWATVLGITVIAHDPAFMGQEAARLAQARMTDRDRTPETVTLPMSLVARGSGEVTPAL